MIIATRGGAGPRVEAIDDGLVDRIAARLESIERVLRDAQQRAGYSAAERPREPTNDASSDAPRQPSRDAPIELPAASRTSDRSNGPRAGALADVRRTLGPPTDNESSRLARDQLEQLRQIAANTAGLTPTLVR